MNTAQATAKPMEFQPFQPAQAAFNQGAENPTEVRYGWCPFKDIYLYNGDGTPYYFIQPTNSPFHRSLPKNHLIPFETFTKTRWERNPSVQATPGNPTPLIAHTETKTAHEAATELLRGYSDRGYVVLNSLQGLSQDVAWRIFRVVQPFDYKLSEIVAELTYGAPERIASETPLEFPDGYTVEPLRNQDERITAHALRAELLDGANRAVVFATEILNDTETSMTTRFSGGKGKTGPDALDQYIAGELDRKLPQLIGKPDETQAFAQKLDFLVEREAYREQSEENTRLRAELVKLQSELRGEAHTGNMESIAMGPKRPGIGSQWERKLYCGHVKADGEQCKSLVESFGQKCRFHKEVPLADVLNAQDEE